MNTKGRWSETSGWKWWNRGQKHTKAWVLGLCATLMLTFASGAFGQEATPLGAPAISGDLVTWPSNPNYRSLLTVSGPGGVWFQREFAAGEVPGVSTTDLGEGPGSGEVIYSLKTLSEIQTEEVRHKVKTGELPLSALRSLESEVALDEVEQFGDWLLSGGAFTENSTPSVKADDGGSEPRTESPEGLQTKSQSLLITNEDLIVESVDIDFLLRDTDSGGAGNWSLSIGEAGPNDLAWQMDENTGTGVYPFIVRNSGPNSIVNHSALVVDGSGDIGLGIFTPVKPLHIADAAPQIRLEDNVGTTGTWDISGYSTRFVIEDDLNDVFTILNGAPEGAFWLNSFGDLGLGTTSPDASLEIMRTDGSAQLLVDEQGADANVEIMFNLVCNCAPAFRMNNSTNGQIWFFRHTSAGDFSFDDPNSAGQEARLDSSGNFFLKGTLSQGSSRALKENLQPSDNEGVLEILDELRLYEWSYLDQSARHFGPMAEEFSAAYGLGESRAKLAPSDLAGVALASAKALRAENVELKRELALIRDLLAELRNKH